MRKCSMCKLLYLESEFSRDKSRKDGLSLSCKHCERERNAKSYQKNLEANRMRRREYAASHKAEASERSRKHYLANREACLRRAKAYHASDPERWKEYQRDWTKANREKRNIVERRWRAKNPEIYRQHLANQKANRRGAPGKVSPKEWQLIKQIYEFTCPSCGLSEPQIKLQRDHIIPVKLGGLNVFGNIQPLCGDCNRKKSNTIKKFEPIKNEIRGSETDSGKV